MTNTDRQTVIFTNARFPVGEAYLPKKKKKKHKVNLQRNIQGLVLSDDKVGCVL